MFNLKFVGDINESGPTFMKIGMENINFENDFNLIIFFLIYLIVFKQNK